ncbi:MAG: FMN-binding protein [Candidatus Aminicenantes bacterium]|nr:MAG: FMN-binding protein [Candidatus Aminicenantes bacterium]
MNRIIFVLLLFLVFIHPSCQKVQDDLDVVKQFKPDDKYFKASLVSLHFIMETSPISRVDQTFSHLIKSHDLPISAQGCKDGVYTGESPFDAYDYKHVVKIEITDEKIVSVDYNEIKKDGIGKQEDEEYCREMSVTGTTPAKAYPKLESQLIEKQNILKVDAVTGATYSLYRFRYAVMIALIKAKLAS